MNTAIPTAIPFAVPLCTLTATLRLDRPWTLAPTPASTPTTSLRGALGTTLSQHTELDALALRFKHPPTRLYANQLPPSLLVSAEETSDPCAFSLRALVRGPHLDGIDALLVDALTRTGSTGLIHGDSSISFALEDVTRLTTTTADAVRARLPSTLPARAMMDFVTPCNAPSFAPAELAGNLACSLVKLQRALDDDGTASKRQVDDEADAARNAAREAFAGVNITRESLADAPRGTRFSGETGQSFSLGGRLGSITLQGSLSAALPWLYLMELHGVGGNTAFGMGRLRIWCA